jgi:hypothetical protein
MASPATTSREMRHPPWRSLIRRDAARFRESIAESTRTLSPWRCEYRILHPRKGEVWIPTTSTTSSA